MLCMMFVHLNCEVVSPRKYEMHDLQAESASERKYFVTHARPMSNIGNFDSSSYHNLVTHDFCNILNSAQGYVLCVENNYFTNKAMCSKQRAVPVTFDFKLWNYSMFKAVSQFSSSSSAFPKDKNSSSTLSALTWFAYSHFVYFCNKGFVYWKYYIRRSEFYRGAGKGR